MPGQKQIDMMVLSLVRVLRYNICKFNKVQKPAQRLCLCEIVVIFPPAISLPHPAHPADASILRSRREANW